MNEVSAFKAFAFYLNRSKPISDCDKCYEDDKMRKMLNEARRPL